MSPSIPFITLHKTHHMQLRITNASEGKVDFELDITKDHTVCAPAHSVTALRQLPDVIVQNRLKILHGGTIASMVDLGGSLAVASMGLYATGVSTDMNSRCVLDEALTGPHSPV